MFLRLFSEVWASSFSFLKFRSESSHSVCTECYRHKALIQALSGHINARVAQENLFHAHLEAQFQDRVRYWESRGESRSHSSRVTVIVDGMDQGKCAVPRHKALHTKLLSGFSRPRLHLTGAIAHGHFVSLYLTEADVPKDSNTSMEIISHCIEQLSCRVNLEHTDLQIQCDNTTREIKNSHILRYCAGLVSSGVVRSMRVSTLRSGHSHEDIDQLFGQVAAHLRSLRNGSTSDDFLESLKAFSRDGMQRPFEKDRYVVKLDQIRDWCLVFC